MVWAQRPGLAFQKGFLQGLLFLIPPSFRFFLSAAARENSNQDAPESIRNSKIKAKSAVSKRWNFVINSKKLIVSGEISFQDAFKSSKRPFPRDYVYFPQDSLHHPEYFPKIMSTNILPPPPPTQRKDS